MAYNNIYPQYYTPYPQMTMPVYQPQVQMQPQQPVKTEQVQNGGFVSIANESMVNSYPIAPGNCVTFKIEGKPLVIEKSMGFSQLESPKIKRYKLIEEEDIAENVSEAVSEAKNDSVVNNAIEDLKAEIDDIWKEIDSLKEAPKKTTSRRKDDDA